MAHPINRRDCLTIFASAAGALAVCEHSSAQDGTSLKKTIFIAADDHTDYMWTADEETYRRVFLETIDHYLDLSDKTDSHPQDFQSRWNCDGLFWMWEYERSRDEMAMRRLISRVKSGHISFPMTMLVSCYGGAPTEAVLRGLYYAGHTERRYGVRFRVAVSMENQTLPLGLATLWSGSGVKYSWKGICGCATKMGSPGNREHDVYWWQGKDGSKILMKWYSLTGPVREGIYANEGPGGYAEARDPTAAIQFVESNENFRKKNPHSVIGLFGQGWDDLKTIIPLSDNKRSFPTVAKMESNDRRRVVVSNELDYFEAFEAQYGDKIPRVASAFGNEWDLYSASLAEVSSSVRRATEKLRTAEAMAAWVAQYESDAFDDLADKRDLAWVAFGLHWEHDWTADGPVSRSQRAAWQRKIAGQIVRYVDELYDRALSRLCGLVNSSASTHSVVVFNPLGQHRSGVIELDLKPNEWLAPSDRDVTGITVNRSTHRSLRLNVPDVPACGFRVVNLRNTSGANGVRVSESNESERVLEVSDSTFRFNHYGEIESWKSHRGGRERVNKGRVLNALIDSNGRVVRDVSDKAESRIVSHSPEEVILEFIVTGKNRRRTIVYYDRKRGSMQLENRIEHNFSELRAWQFAFASDQSRVIHEEVGAVIRAATHSNGGDYADRNSRTDWLSLNHFVAVKNQALPQNLWV